MSHAPGDNIVLKEDPLSDIQSIIVCGSLPGVKKEVEILYNGVISVKISGVTEIVQQLQIHLLFNLPSI
jgi:hypothetical protein